MAIQQRVRVLTDVAGGVGGDRGETALLVRHRHRWRKWSAFILHEVLVIPSHASGVALGAGFTTMIYAAMRDTDMWGAQYTARYVPPPDTVTGVAGAPEGQSVPGLLAFERFGAEAVTGVSYMRRWTSLPRLVAADAIMIQYGADANVPLAGWEVLFRWEEITLPGWQAWEEAVMNTMGRQRSAVNP